MKKQKNVLGETLESCSTDPITGWFRDGCCNTCLLYTSTLPTNREV